MRQAITTRYIGPTNTRGARVKATAAAGSVIVGWNNSLEVDANHTAAALALCRKYGWHGTLYAGGLASGDGNAYVMRDDCDAEIKV